MSDTQVSVQPGKAVYTSRFDNEILPRTGNGGAETYPSQPKNETCHQVLHAVGELPVQHHHFDDSSLGDEHYQHDSHAVGDCQDVCHGLTCLGSCPDTAGSVCPDSFWRLFGGMGGVSS